MSMINELNVINELYAINELVCRLIKYANIII